MTWIFAYGSLIWRPGFEVAERRVSFAQGWARRFWQGSTDHRGTPEAPGRVVTLVRSPHSRCFGVAMRVGDADIDGVLASLDEREQGGYERLELAVVDQQGVSVPALTYVAPPANPNWLGSASTSEISKQIANAVGPSGVNREYVEKLSESLAQLGVEDEHVIELAGALGQQ